MVEEHPTYEIEYHCNNCNHFFKQKFFVGAVAPKMIICIRCQVSAAEKAWTNPNPWPTMPIKPSVPYDDRPWYPVIPKRRPFITPWPKSRPGLPRPGIIYENQGPDRRGRGFFSNALVDLIDRR